MIRILEKEPDHKKHIIKEAIQVSQPSGLFVCGCDVGLVAEYS